MNKQIAALFLLVLALFGPVGAEETATVTEHRVNVRGKPSLVGEVVTQLQEGDTVTVLERIPADDPKPGDPATWAKIKLPANTPIWASGLFIKDGEVTATRLNLRAGPGENYSVLGRVPKGTKLKEIRRIEDWAEVEQPEGAYAFIDADLLKSSTAATASTAPAGTTNVTAASSAPGVAAAGKAAPTAAPQSPVATPATTAQTPATTAQIPSGKTPGTTTTTAALPQQPPAQARTTPSPAPGPFDALQPSTVAPTATGAALTPRQTPEKAPDDEMETAAATAAAASPLVAARPPSAPADTSASSAFRPVSRGLPQVAPAQPQSKTATPPRRLVRREGIVKMTKSVQAPSWYSLEHPVTGKTINYLRAEKLGVDLKYARGQRVIVEGEEGIDARWPNTPVMELDSIETAP